MAAAAVKDSSRLTRRVAIVWAVVFAALIAAFFVTVAVLNGSLYSAHGFVSSYLHALERHDVTEALATPGVVVDADADRILLSGAALGELSDIRLVSDTAQGQDRQVVFSYRLGATAEGTSTFLVESTGKRFGLFSSWSFAESPVSTLAVTPLHDPRFEINGISVVSSAAAGDPSSYPVLTPGIFEVTHHSTFLTAKKVVVPVTVVGDVAEARVDVEANDSFVSQVDKELRSYLDECATQQVLQPTGCPFGYQTGNRIEDLPQWSMSEYPRVKIVPGDEPGTWRVPASKAAAHLKVHIRSLFDGSVSLYDKDVPFTVGYLITFDGNGDVKITAQY